MFRRKYENVFTANEKWNSIPVPEGELYEWDEKSTYIQNPPFFEKLQDGVQDIKEIRNARVLALLNDSVTTDHISPAGNIAPSSPAGLYLKEHGVERKDFNSYGSRRGNHEVMMRGTFANIRIRNNVAPGTEGGVTKYLPTDEEMSIYDASMKYQAADQNLIVIAGKEYGTGSSRDWAVKVRFCWALRLSLPKASSGFTAVTWSAWVYCLCNSRKAMAGPAWYQWS